MRMSAREPRHGNRAERPLLDRDSPPCGLAIDICCESDANDDKHYRLSGVTAPANQGGTIDGSLAISCDTVNTIVKVTIEGSICPRCNGTGKVKCTKCGGKGWYDRFMMTSSGAIYGCTNCGGYGEEAMVDDPPIHKGSGRMTCPDCGGKGS